MADASRQAFVRPHLRAIEPVVHGSVAATELAALGLRIEDVVDFSVSTNPLGPAPAVLQAAREANWGRYPGDDEGPLRSALAALCDVAVDQVVVGNG